MRCPRAHGRDHCARDGIRCDARLRIRVIKQLGLSFPGPNRYFLWCCQPHKLDSYRVSNLKVLLADERTYLLLFDSGDSGAAPGAYLRRAAPFSRSVLCDGRV
jgi:hypothetical protein